jgi:hypothetical protein
LFSLLGACDASQTDGGGLLANLVPPQDAALPPVPLSQALMMRGQVTLVPPRGYCIDPESLSQSFALMARCDTMGAATGGNGAPIGVLTVSFARNVLNPDLPSAQDVATAFALAPPENSRTAQDSVIFKTTGTAPTADLSPDHWRAVAKVAGFTMGLALFGPEGRRAVSAEGAEVLQETITRTTARTNAA